MRSVWTYLRAPQLCDSTETRNCCRLVHRPHCVEYRVLLDTKVCKVENSLEMINILRFPFFYCVPTHLPDSFNHKQSILCSFTIICVLQSTTKSSELNTSRFPTINHTLEYTVLGIQRGVSQLLEDILRESQNMSVSMTILGAHNCDIDILAIRGN